MRQVCCYEPPPEWLALQQAYVVCLGHEAALRDALEDLKQRKLVAADLAALSKEDRRLLDQFAYRNPLAR